MACASLLVAVGACASPHGAGTSTSLDAWRAYHRSVIADLEDLARRGSAAAQAQDFATMGSVCREGVVVIATAMVGPVAPDAELQRHYSLMEKSYEAGFSTCAAGTSASFDRSLASLDNGNQELRAATARLRTLAPA